MYHIRSRLLYSFTSIKLTFHTYSILSVVLLNGLSANHDFCPLIRVASAGACLSVTDSYVPNFGAKMMDFGAKKMVGQWLS